ncbi:putative secreted protein (type I secretion substrate), partial [Onishia taeanensis]
SATGTLTYTVSDGTATDTATVTLTVNGVNDAPASSDSQFTVQEDTAYTLDLDDFGHYTDIEGDALAAIEITSLPENGVLELSGEQVSAGDTIAISAIEAGDLVFVPDTNTDEDGAFGFRVQDAAGDWSQSTYQAAVVVEAIADTPEVAIQLGAPSELKDTLQYESKSLTFDAKLGDDKGDGNIDGNSSNYEESVSQTLSFGPQYAGQTVSLTLDVDIQGTWNQGWGVTDDYWQVLSGDEVLETFKYGSPLNEDVSGNVITNIAVVLDENGEVELSFRASTTEKSETVTINGATGEVAGTTYEVVTGYEYSIDVSAALQDRDGSESLSLLIEGVPEGATLSQGTDNGDGTWTLSVAPGEQDFATNLTMTTPANVNGGFTLTVKATATEASGGDLAVNTAMAVASAYEPGSPSLDAPSAEPIIAGYHGYVSGQGNGNNTGTYANNNGLKETSASNAEAIVSADGFYSVERNGNPHSETSDRIDPTEALVLELGQAVNSVTFEVQGNVGEAQWSVFAANGDRLGGGSALGEPNSEGFLTVSYDMPFSYIALDGGDDSAFAVKPIGVGIAGTASDDTLNGSAGDDTLIGGEGDDILYGQEGADVFAWQLGDEGQPGNPAQDTVKDFSLAEGDSLDLAELLVDEQPGSIDDYLHAAPSASGGDTILHVSTGGGFAGDYANNSGQENQTITLEGVSMGDQSSQEFINDLINNGNLNIDQ